MAPLWPGSRGLWSWGQHLYLSGVIAGSFTYEDEPALEQLLLLSLQTCPTSSLNLGRGMPPPRNLK